MPTSGWSRAAGASWDSNGFLVRNGRLGSAAALVTAAAALLTVPGSLGRITVPGVSRRARPAVQGALLGDAHRPEARAITADGRHPRDWRCGRPGVLSGRPRSEEHTSE